VSFWSASNFRAGIWIGESEVVIDPFHVDPEDDTLDVTGVLSGRAGLREVNLDPRLPRRVTDIEPLARTVEVGDTVQLWVPAGVSTVTVRLAGPHPADAPGGRGAWACT